MSREFVPNTLKRGDNSREAALRANPEPSLATEAPA